MKKYSKFSLRRAALLTWFLLCYASPHSQTVNKMDNQTWHAIDDVVANEFAQHNLKGISVAVVYGGNIAYANGMGDKNADGDPYKITDCFCFENDYRGTGHAYGGEWGYRTQ